MIVFLDKNPDRMEEAKVEFQALQQAYETLSNPQERAWYDKHRTAILKGNTRESFSVIHSFSLMDLMMMMMMKNGMWNESMEFFVSISGLDEESGEDIIDIFPFMTSGCYKGFGDDEEWFYAVYR